MPLATQVMSSLATKTKDRKLRKQIHAKHHAHFSSFSNRDMIIEAYRSSVHDTVMPVARQIKVPTLIISGTKDTVAPYNDARQLAKVIPNATFVGINDVGHILHHEAPSLVARDTADFIKVA
jgi:pimeloyl-ACP methyl ester carboxylesterase